MNRLTSSRALCIYPALRVKSHTKYYSNSPSSPSAPRNNFNKTGEREALDSVKTTMRTDEYSKSGGDDIVAEQEIASFKKFEDTDPATQKATAGKSNVINPLEVSPATPEVSKIITEHHVEKNVERDPSARSGQGITASRKSKKVEKVEIDFGKIKMHGR